MYRRTRPMYRRRKRQLPPPPPVSMREFIKAWQESSSLAEVAQKVQSKKNACRVRAYRYRQMGVPLKEFPVVYAEPTDWEELAEYGASLLPDAEARRKAGWIDYDEPVAASAEGAGGGPTDSPAGPD